MILFCSIGFYRGVLQSAYISFSPSWFFSSSTLLAVTLIPLSAETYPSRFLLIKFSHNELLHGLVHSTFFLLLNMTQVSILSKNDLGLDQMVSNKYSQNVPPVVSPLTAPPKIEQCNTSIAPSEFSFYLTIYTGRCVSSKPFLPPCRIQSSFSYNIA